MKELIEAGKIVGTHGVRGEMRLQPWTDSPEFLTKFKKIFIEDDRTTERKVSFRCHKNMNILKMDGVDTIEQAENYRNKIIYIKRADIHLEKGKYLLQDLIGCKVFDSESNAEYGVISDVSQLPANDVWHIKRNDKEYLFPAVSQFIIKVDVKKQEIFINSPKGIFDNEN